MALSAPRVSGGPSFAAIGLGLSMGAALYFLASEPAPWLAFWALLVLLLVGVVLHRVPLPLVAVVLGFCWSHLWACALLCDPFPDGLAQQDVTLIGRVASLPDVSDERTRFLFQVEELLKDGELLNLSGRVRLSWYQDAPALKAGERWRLSARLKPPHGFVNPGGFDYERWLFRHQVKATGYVRSKPPAERLDAGAGGYLLDRWRQQLRERLHQTSPSGVGAALIPALVIGDRGALTPAQWTVFSRTGTSHLIAISGLHVGLIAGALFLLVRRTWALAPALALKVAAPRAGALAALGGAFGYAALAGFAVSTQRALVMLAVVLIAILAGRTLRAGSALLLALAAVLIVDPGAVLDYGFWLSFGAVAVLLYALGWRLGPPGWIARWGAAQWAVALGLLPLLIAFFGQASLIAPLVNLVAVPLFGVLLPLVLLASLTSLISAWAWPLLAVDWLLTQVYVLLVWAAGLPWAAVTMGARPGWVWLLAGLGAALLLAPRGIPGRWLGLVLLLPLWLVRPPAPAPGELQVTLLDVGQGLAGVLRTHRHTLVYDVGPRFRSGFNTGEAVVGPYLRHQGIDKIDLLILSHADQDHAGGVQGLLSSIEARRILSGEPEEIDVPGVEPCRRGQRWRWDGVEFRLLHPADGSERGNDSSCVLRVSVAGTALLWPGDVEAGVERALVQRERDDLRADVLIAGHHGSGSSTTMPFLQAVSPRLVLFSMGWKNRFGFPVNEVRERVQALEAGGLDTASAGGIELRIRPDGALEAPRPTRQEADRLWRHHPAPAMAGEGDRR